MTDYQRWIRQVIKFCKNMGWIVQQNGHLKFKSPDGKVIVCSVSPKNAWAMHNVRRDFKKIGVILDV